MTHRSLHVLRFLVTLRGTGGHGSESKSRTRKLYNQPRPEDDLSWTITDVDLEIFVVVTVMSLISDITYRASCQQGKRRNDAAYLRTKGIHQLSYHVECGTAKYKISERRKHRTGLTL